MTHRKRAAGDWTSPDNDLPGLNIVSLPMPLASHEEQDLHGNAPDSCPVALLLIDLINDLEFPENEDLVRRSGELASRVAGLKKRCKQAGIPAIYINDNHGKWRSDFMAVLRHSLRTEAPGRAMVERLQPEAEDYVVLKPKHSAFFATPLDVLLQRIGVRTLIIAGLTTNACVMVSASEAYVRDYRLLVPADCVAALNSEEQRTALELMEQNFGVDTTFAEEVDLEKLKGL